MRISDWSSDVCSADLLGQRADAIQALRRYRHVQVRSMCLIRRYRAIATGDAVMADHLRLAQLLAESSSAAAQEDATHNLEMLEHKQNGRASGWERVCTEE